MSNIRLFNHDVVSDLDYVGSLGLGKLSDAISCTVTEERNGVFELEMEYPITGARYDQLALRMIIVCPPNPYDTPQAFRIYSISRAINGIVTVNAQHISYDLSDAMVRSAKVSSNTLSPYDIWSYAKSNRSTGFSGGINGFELETTLTVNESIVDAENNHLTKWELKGPKSLRRILLGDDDDSIMKNYVGSTEFGDEPEFTFDNHHILLQQERGTNRGVTIRYRKNMTGFTQEDSMENLYTHVYPFFYASSITYNEDGRIDGTQRTKENFSVDLSFIRDSSYTTDPTLKTGILDKDGNELTFRHIFPLDVSSLYKGDFAVNFANEECIAHYNQVSLVQNTHTNHDMWSSIEVDSGVGTLPHSIRISNNGEWKPNTTYPRSKYNIWVNISGRPNVEVNLDSDITVDSDGVVTAMVKYFNKEPDYTFYIDALEWFATIEGNGDVDKNNSNYINLDDPATLEFGALQIKKAAERYIKENHMFKFPISLKVDMTMAKPLDIESLYKIKLCDKIRVEYPSYNLSAVAKCTKTVYDAIGERYTELDFSNYWVGLASSTASTVSATARSFRNMNYIGGDLNYLKVLSNFIK